MATATGERDYQYDIVDSSQEMGLELHRTGYYFNQRQQFHESFLNLQNYTSHIDEI